MSNPGAISSPFFSFPDGISILGVDASDTGLVVSITCHLPFALCPGCQQRSERILELTRFWRGLKRKK